MGKFSWLLCWLAKSNINQVVWGPSNTVWMKSLPGVLICPYTHPSQGHAANVVSQDHAKSFSWRVWIIAREWVTVFPFTCIKNPRVTGLDFFLNHANVKAKNWSEPGLKTCIFIRLGDWHWITPDMRVMVCLAGWSHAKSSRLVYFDVYFV